ncbi:tetratricopeptide repeat protein [Nocardia alni]|uniref:tetratricopeptide repeat protein n=1 Tax=Nocardia alni TaxID=2815723 RepID=UPI0020B33ECC|nr:tetratricopeptide repeat protein [Nocardia alni]
MSELFEAAGNPTLEQVVRATRARLQGRRGLPTVQRVSDWRSGRNVPAKFSSLEPVLATLIFRAQSEQADVPAGLLNITTWQRVWQAALDEVGSTTVAPVPPASAQDAAVRSVVVDTLPRDVGTLIGRDDEVQRILDAAGERPATSSIRTIDGMPGIGKTVLATRVAHRLAGRFPDGRYFVSLHAHTPGRPTVKPTDVLAGLLTDLGVDPRNIPDTLENRRNLWRDRVAGKRILLVLDDVADYDQVEPLLPNGPGCLTLITSRRHLIALDGSEPFALDTLDPDKAAELFWTLSRRTPGGEDRAAVREIVRLCGYLPLAIVLLAGRLAYHTSWTVAEMAADLATAQDRLGELEAGERAVRAAFTMSYRDLPAERQRLFRQLSLHPGPAIDRHAAAVLGGLSPARARRELEALFTDHLLDEPDSGRYRMHDLLHEYALELVERDPVDERRETLDALLDHYEHTAETADRFVAVGLRLQVSQDPEPAGTPYFSDRAGALTWLRTERENLLACLEYAASHHQSARVIGLTSILSGLLRLDGPWPLAIRLHRRAATVAEHSGDLPAAADALNDLAGVRYATGDYPGTAEVIRQALRMYRDIGDRVGQAHALNSLGRLGYATGDYPGTVELIRQALALYREVGDRLGEAYALSGLGVVRYATGDYPGAASLVQQALAIFRQVRDRLGEAYALDELGVIRYATGDYVHAVAAEQQALEIYRQTGDRFGEAYALGDLASVRFATGDYTGAAELGRQALAICRDVGDRLNEAYAIDTLATAKYATGEAAAAAEQVEQALEIFEEIGDRVGTAYVHGSLGMVRYSTGDYMAAAEQMRRELAIFQEIGDRVGQGYTQLMIGLVRYAAADYHQANDLMRAALAIFEEIGDRVGQAYVLNGLGRLRYAADAIPEGVADLDRALGIFREVGDRIGEAYTLGSMGRLRFAAGDMAAAEALVRQALSIYRATGDRLGHAFSLDGLALLRYAEGNYGEATFHLQEATAIVRGIGDRVMEAYSLMLLGLLRYQAGDYRGAAELVEQAPGIFREIGDRIGEAYAFLGLGLVRFKAGDYSAADLAGAGLALFRELGDEPGRAEVVEQINQLWEESSGPQNAVVSYVDALRAIREIHIRWKRRRVWRDLPVPEVAR